MPPKSIVPALIVCALFLARPASAQDIALTARAGTLGPGVEVTTSLDSHFNVRLGLNHLNYTRDDHIADLEVGIDVASDVRFTSFALVADVLPFEKYFRMSLGLVYNHNEVSALAVPSESYSIEGKTFEPDRIGTIEATLDHRRAIQPYMGIGFGNPLRGRVSFLLDLGMLYTDSPRLQMQGTGMIAPTAGQASQLEESLYSFRWYPVAAVGLAIRL